jgi:hypothetical protein
MSGTVTGGCHCGVVRFEAEADLAHTMQCNCSICQNKGLILTFAPREQFRLLSGEDQLAEYRFNKHVIAHRFCTVCGVQPFAYAASPDGKAMAAINVRCVDGVDLETLTPQRFDGRSL